MTEAFNVDCMEYMRSVPDKYFDLAVVDPPYGDAGGDLLTRPASANGLTAINRGGVARQAEISPRYIPNARTSDSRMGAGVTRTGGTWAEKYAKKLLRGT